MPGGYLIFVFLPIVNSYYCIISGYLMFVFLPFLTLMTVLLVLLTPIAILLLLLPLIILVYDMKSAGTVWQCGWLRLARWPAPLRLWWAKQAQAPSQGPAQDVLGLGFRV